MTRLTRYSGRKAAENNDDLRALINAGFERNAPAGRTVGPTHIPTDFNTFAMVALAGIGRMPDTIEDRAVVVMMMKRRTADEPVHPYRLRPDQPDVHKLRDRLAEWVDTVRDRAGAEYPELPIEDRAADLWEPLVSVAELAGGDWPELARAAAKVLTDTSADDDARSFNVLLLNDIEALFDDVADGFIKSADLCKRLRGLDESPWSDIELTPIEAGSAAVRRVPYPHPQGRQQRAWLPQGRLHRRLQPAP